MTVNEHRLVRRLSHNGFECACGYRRESPGYLTADSAFEGHRAYAEQYLDEQPQKQLCSICEGTGYIHLVAPIEQVKCEACRGTGKLWPAGIEKGSMTRNEAERLLLDYNIERQEWEREIQVLAMSYTDEQHAITKAANLRHLAARERLVAALMCVAVDANDLRGQIERLRAFLKHLKGEAQDRDDVKLMDEIDDVL